MKKTVFKRAPHPPYSFDISPSDFCLFGYVKDELKDQSFKTREELFQKIISIIHGIQFEKRKNVFDD